MRLQKTLSVTGYRVSLGFSIPYLSITSARVARLAAGTDGFGPLEAPALAAVPTAKVTTTKLVMQRRRLNERII
jgi:hypothetical protein